MYFIYNNNKERVCLFAMVGTFRMCFNLNIISISIEIFIYLYNKYIVLWCGIKITRL